MVESKSARVRRQLDHPVIDADGHWQEPHPVFFEYIAEVAGPAAVDKYRTIIKGRYRHWYEAIAEQRLRHRACAGRLGGEFPPG